MTRSIGVRSLLVGVAVLALALAALAGCGLLAPAPRELTPREILDRAAEAAEQVNTVHFNLEIEGGSLSLGPGLQVTRAEGDVVRPDRVRLKASFRLGTMSAESQLVAIGQELYLTNPLTGRWERMPGGVVALRVLDSERGVPNLLRRLSEAQKVATETLDGVATHHLRGTLPASAIADMVGGQARDEQVAGEVWVGVDDFLLRQARIQGAIAAAEKAGVVRLLKFSRFNEAITIEPPL